MPTPTAILLLAAGGSARLGEAKQLLDASGEPLVRRVARQLVGLAAGPVGVVVGARRDVIAAALAGLDVTLVDNTNWQRGLGSSIAAGVAWASRDPATARALIVLCDQPAIDAAHLRALLSHEAAAIVATAYAAVVGVPAVFPRAMFARLASLPAGGGAKGILNDPAIGVIRVRCDDAAIDLDTPEDVRRWRTSRGL